MSEVLLRLTSAVIILLGVLLFIGCEKEENLDPKFSLVTDCFTNDCIVGQNSFVLDHFLNSSNGVAVDYKKEFTKALVSYWQKYQQTDLPEQYGFPVWKSAVLDEVTERSISQLYLPLIKEESRQVEAILVVTAKLSAGEFGFKLLNRSELNSLAKVATPDLFQRGLSTYFGREAAIAIFVTLDEQLFGTSDLASTPLGPMLKDCKTRIYQTTTCWAVYGGTSPDRTLLYTECSVSHSTITSCGGVARGSNSGGRGGGGGGGGGSTSGGSSRGSGREIVVVDREKNRCEEDGVGCEEEDEEKDEIITLQRDSIRIDESVNELRCVHNMLEDYLNLKHNLRTMITDIFGPTPRINLRFQAGYTGSNLGIHRIQGSGPNNSYGFTSEITLSNNPAHSNCSKDLVLSTIVHESIHAYYTYLKDTQGGYIVRKYPLFITEINNYFDHFAMAEDYVDDIADLLRTYNPRLSPRHAEHLAWGGLAETPAYKKLSQSTKDDIEETMKAAMCKQTAAEIATYNFRMCN